MIKLLRFLCCLIFFLSIHSNSDAAVYEASTLHNAVSRSETVQDLFADRWEEILDKALYVDVYGKINWLHNFKINALNRGTGQKEPVNMTLVRTYGSLTVNIPVSGKYKRQKKQDDISNETLEEPALWQEDNLLIGLTMTGFHYGLTRKVKIDRGVAGEETATDYKYTQFYDDIFAVSILYVPYIYIHGGLIMNSEIEPNDDGTISYGEKSSHEKRFFFSSNILSFLNVNASTTADRLESTSFDIEINSMIELFTEPMSPFIPRVSIGYKYVRLYNDEAYDAVWVGSVYQNDGVTLKSSAMSDSEKDRASLHALRLGLVQHLADKLTIDIFVAIQKTPEDLYDKQDNKKIRQAIIKEFKAEAGFNLFTLFDMKKYHKLILSYGWSSFWDPGIAFHRESGDGYRIYGWTCALEYKSFWGGAEIRGYRNYSPELRRLIEAADKYSFEVSCNYRY